MNVAKVYKHVAYVAMVVHVYCKGLFLIFHLCFWMYCCKCVYLDVAYVSAYAAVIWILRMFVMIFKLFSCFTSVSEACFKCFIYLQMYIASIASRYFKDRSGVANIAMRVINPCLVVWAHGHVET